MKHTPHRPFRRTPAALACIPLLALALGACTDQQPLIQASGAGPSRNTGVQHPEWRGYWRSPTELWVYDMTPEIGINSAYGEAATLQRFRNAGMRLVRHGMPWGIYAQNPAGFQGADLQAGQTGTTYVLVLNGGRDGNMQNSNPADSLARNAIYRQMAADVENMVRLYPNVKFYQLWNEPDASCEPGKFFNGANAYGNSSYLYPNRYVQGRNYADMLRIVYPRMKAAARAQGREVWLVMAALTGKETIAQRTPTPEGGTDCHVGSAVSWDFARGVYDNGGKAYFDIAAIHTYGATATSQGSMLELSHGFNWQLNAVLNDANRPLWVTEFGTSAVASASLLSPTRDISRDGVVIDSIQRRWYEDAVIIQRDGNHLQKILGYTFVSPEGGSLPNSGITGADPWSYGLGVFRGDRVTPRPAFQFLQSRAGTNALAESRGTRTGVFRIQTSGQVPAVHPYHYEGNVIVVENVQVNTLYPTVIPMKWPGATEPTPDPCPTKMTTCVPT